MGDSYFLYFYFCRAIVCLLLFISFSYAYDRISLVTSLIKEAMLFYDELSKIHLLRVILTVLYDA
jgi:hypothetical protein